MGIVKIKTKQEHEIEVDQFGNKQYIVVNIWGEGIVFPGLLPFNLELDEAEKLGRGLLDLVKQAKEKISQ